MTMVWQWLGQASVTTVLIAILVFVFKDWFRARLTASVNHEYARALEEIRAGLARVSATHTAATEAFRSGEMALVPRRILAIERLWTATIKQRLSQPPAVFMSDLLTIEELNEPIPQMKAAMQQLTEDELLDWQGDVLEKEAERPFTDPVIWALGSAIRQFRLRAAWVMKMNFEKGLPLDWRDDRIVKEILSKLFAESDLAAFRKEAVNRVWWVTSRLEDRLLQEIQRSMSGEHASSKALANAAEIVKILGNERASLSAS